MRSVLASLSVAVGVVAVLATGCSGSAEEQDADMRVDLTDQGSFEVDGLFSVAPLYAERSADGLGVVVELQASDLPLTVGTKRAVYVVGADLVKADEAPEVSVAAGESGDVRLDFPGRALATGGQLTFEVSVGGQPPTSVGFGLAQSG